MFSVVVHLRAGRGEVGAQVDIRILKACVGQPLASREIAQAMGQPILDRQKDVLPDEIRRRMEQKTECNPLFTIKWRIA